MTWSKALETAKEFKLPPGAVFKIISAFQDNIVQPNSRRSSTSRCPEGYWEPGLGPCICEGRVHG